MDQLNHKIIEEMVRGGPARYRGPYAPSRRHAAYGHEPEGAGRSARAKVLCVRLPWLFAIIRLPAWSPIGVALD